MLLFSSPRFADHVPPPGHPERIERAETFDKVARQWQARGGTVREPRPATRDELRRVHTAAYLDQLAETAGRPVMFDADTFTSTDSYEVALLAAGASIDAARHAHQTGEPALALVRPPGHHAEPGRAMGFCLLNNIAIAAAALRADGAERVAIVDIDVHHGNGTQDAFYGDPTVLYVSMHQHPYYPGTGAADERGSGAGVGFTMNIPLPAGATDRDVQSALRAPLMATFETFRPEAMLVSAGFDAHALDPLGGLRMTTAGYRTLVEWLDASARQLCGRRIAFITEGGYHLEALEECLEATIDVLS